MAQTGGPEYRGEEPDVTVVIPTCDRPRLLPRAITSALKQTFAWIEVVIVDDASTPPVRIDTADPRVRVARLGQRVGVCAARNEGLRLARGKWVVFLDDDDELLPDMVQVSREAVRTSRRPAPVSALSGITVVNGAGHEIEQRLPISLDRGEAYLAAGDVRELQDANTLFAPVETLRAIGGWNEALKGWEIDDLFLRLTRVSSIEGVPFVTYRMNHHRSRRLTTDSWSMIHGAERTLDEYRDLFEAYPKRRAVYLRRLGALYLEAGRWQQGVKALWRALLLDPTEPRAVPRLLVGLGGPVVYRFVRGARRRLGSL
jgi:glycosyltransferase involved in cell wall biosynthesis